MMTRQRWWLLSGLGAAIGLVFILLAELAGLDWLRVFGAALISFGGIGLGVLAGLELPARERLLGAGQWLRDWRVVIGIVAAVLPVSPVLAALVAALVGLGGSGNPGADETVVVIGAIIAVAMLVLTAGGLVIAIRAIRRASQPEAPPFFANGHGHADGIQGMEEAP